MKKRFILKGTTNLWLVAAIIAMAFTACTKKSDTQSQTATAEQTHTANPHPEILNGDFSAFAGTWVSEYGDVTELRADGHFDRGYQPFNFRKDGDRYGWDLAADGDSTTLWLYPVGIEIYGGMFDATGNWKPGMITTDTTKVRIYTVFGSTPGDIVYYREGEAPAAALFDRYAKILSGDFSAFAGIWVNGKGTRVELKPNGVFGNYAEYPDVIIGNVRIAADGVYLWSIGTEWFDSPITMYPAGIDVMGGNGILQTDTTKVRITAVDIPYRNDEVYYQPDYHVQFKGETIYMTFTLLPQMSGNTKIGDILTYLNFSYEDKQHQIDLEYLGPISYTGPGSVNISAGDYNSDGFMDLTINGVIIHYNSQTKSYPMPNDPYAGFSPQGVQ